MPRLALAVAAVASVLFGPASPAAAQHDPPEPATATVVRTVEVPVPVHDWTTEAVHMGVAAVLGAALAARTTARRFRRRDTSSGTGVIDLTDVVQFNETG
jgi:hypothetical protein